jgi:hypothetical protein
MRPPRSLSSAALLAVTAFALVLSGCDCRGGSGIGNGQAELGVVWTDESGASIVSRDATYDFGPAFVGERVSKQLVVRNLGRGTLRLVELNPTEGVAVTIGDDVKPNAFFEVKFHPAYDLPSTGELAIDMAFTPRVGVKAPVAKLALVAEGTRPEDSTAVITLKGQGEGGVCDLPDVLDFGEVPLGEHFKLSWTFRNPAAIATSIRSGAITGSDAASFQVSEVGELVLNAGEERAVEYTFSPTELRDYEAKTTLKGPGECPEGEVTLKGRGAESVLSWSPPEIDFGYVSPNVSAPREVVFVNRSNVPIVLNNVHTSFADFEYLPPQGETPTTFTVAGNGTSRLTVACKPGGLGPRSTTLEFDTGIARQPHGTVSLKCVGGGPAIKVTPRPTLNFGKVALFPGVSTYEISRKVTVQNVGTRPPNGDVYGNLFFGQLVNGMPGQFPLIEITPTNANTAPDEFDVGLPSSYDPARGLEAVAGRSYADLLITLHPKTAGAKAAELTIYSNDPVEPVIKVQVTADAQQLPPCNLSVTPANLNFGLVTPPDSRQLPVALKNLGVNPSETCYLSGIELAAGSDPAFSIVGGNIDEKVLMANETFNVVVKVSPTGPVSSTTRTLTGALHFNVSSPTNPQRVVPVQATIGPVCLTIVPDQYDFGNVKKDCNTAPQEFTVYNTCASDVFINGVTMQVAAGQPAGGPNCPGGAPCPEFILTATPAIPSGGLRLTASATTAFRVKYHPIDHGADSGAVAINAVQSGQNVTYLVSLSGTGDMDGLQTDTFVQAAAPKADVLMVIDASCSMGDKQTSLGSNFASFITYAVSTGVDWQIGVITTDTRGATCTPLGCVPTPGGATASILRGDASNPKILTPAVPMVEQKFSAKVAVGTNGNDEAGFQAALDALTPPLITNENAGFLRYDANLAIVVVSDAGDQSTQGYSYYLNRFRNIKGYQRANMFTFNVIGPFLASAPAPCTYDDFTDSSTYHAMTMDTQGVEYEICAPDWATKLQDLGKTAFGYRTVFFLSAQPDLTMGRTIDVKIDGAAVPAGSYTYDPATLSIEFTPATTPGPGKTLTITYYKACL